MDQPNVWRVRFFGIASCAAGLLACCDTASAQEAPAPSGGGSFFSRDLGTALRVDYNSEYYGTDKGVVAIGGMKVFNGEGSTWFLDAQGTLSDDFGGGYNAGVGYRILRDTQLPYDSQRIHGISFWSDGQSTSADNFFSQLGVSLESMGDKWDARLSGYFPLTRSKTGDAAVGSLDDPFYEGFRLLSTTEVVPVDTALTVVDGELAHRLMDLEAWGFIGGYHLGGGGFDDGGYRVGVRGYAVPDLQVTLQVSDDDIYGTNVSAGLTWFVGRTTRANQPVGNIMDRFREPVLRNDFIATTQRFDSTGTGALTDNTSGDELAFIHVDSGDGSALGDGSFENPYGDLSDVPGSNEDAIILVHGGSMLTSGHAFEDGQRLLGEGLDADSVPVVHTVNTTELGLIDLPETAVGASSLMRPTISGVAGDIFTMADNNEVNNFSVDGGARGIVASMQSGIVASNLALMNQTDAAAAAIDLDQVTGTNIIDNSVVVTGAAGRGIRVVDSSGLLGATATIEDTGSRAVEMDGWGGGSATFGQIGTETTANTGGIDVRNSTGGTITFSSLANIDTSGAPAFNAATIEDNTGTTITFEDLRATDTVVDTVFIRGGGTVNINNSGGMSTIANTGTGDAVRVEGVGAGAAEDPSVSVASDITNTGGGLAVAVEGLESGTGATFSGNITDTDTNGMGILVQNNTTGTIAFTGTTTLDTGANTAAEITDNEGATVTFSDLIATSASTTGTFVVNGGGTVDVNDVNDTSNITNTGNGPAVLYDSMGGAIDGDASGTIAADISNTSNTADGRAIVIQNRTANNLNFTGTIGDDTAANNGGIQIDNVTGGAVAFTEAINVDTDQHRGVEIVDSSALFTFSNTATVNAETTQEAVFLSNNDGSTITFEDLIASSTDGDTFSVIGGGTVNVNDINNTSTITNTGTADAVRIDGNEGGVVGDATVAIAADIDDSGGGLAVRIEDRTANNVTISGAVGDGSAAAGSDGGVLIEDITGGTIGFTEVVTVNENANTGVQISGTNTGGTFTFNGLDITTDGTSGFSATGGGTLAASNSINPNTVDVTGGAGTTGVEINGMTINAAGVSFDTVDVAGGENGVVLTDNDGGAIVIGSDTTTPGNISNTTVNAIEVDGGTSNVTVNTTASVGVGGVLDVQNRTGGTTTIAGDLTTTGGTGVNIANNTGGTVDVSGDLTLETGANDAVSITGNDGSSVSLTGTTIDLQGTTGNGVNVSGTNTAVTIDADVTGGAAAAMSASVRVGGDTVTNISGNITNAAGATVLAIDGLTNGQVNATGDLTRTADGSTGVEITGNTGGTAILSGDITLSTGAGTGIEITGNGAGFSGNIAGSATNNVEVTTTSGTGLLVNGGGNIDIVGNSTNVNTISTGAGVGIAVTNAEDLAINFTDVATATQTAITVDHNNGSSSDVAFDQVRVTDGVVGYAITAAGAGEFDVTIDDANVAGVEQQGILLATNAGSSRVDFTLTGSTINTDVVGNTESAFEADITGGTGDIRFLIQGNSFTNDDSTSPTVDIALTSNRVLNATIGSTVVTDAMDPTSDLVGPIGAELGISNTFTNTNTAAVANPNAFQVEVDNAAAIVNLDLRSNSAFAGSGAVQYTLTQTNGTFNLVDSADTINNVNNVPMAAGTVDANGTINNLPTNVALPTP